MQASARAARKANRFRWAWASRLCGSTRSRWAAPARGLEAPGEYLHVRAAQCAVAWRAARSQSACGHSRKRARPSLQGACRSADRTLEAGCPARAFILRERGPAVSFLPLGGGDRDEITALGTD